MCQPRALASIRAIAFLSTESSGRHGLFSRIHKEWMYCVVQKMDSYFWTGSWLGRGISQTTFFLVRDYRRNVFKEE